MNRPGSIAVVGGGISGLTVAFWLQRWGIDVTVMEAGAEPGGTMRTLRDGGWLIEQGPNSALETTPLFGEMFSALGLECEYANPASDRRYVLRGGALHPLPMSPGAFLLTGLWTMRGKLRIFGEPFIGRGDREETIAEFVERRLGREMLDYAINPFVAGVYAGNPEQLSVRAAFPKLYALEERYGGLIMGMIRGARERRKRQEKAKDRARMFSFRSGMQAFPAAIARQLGGRIRLNSPVEAVSVLKGEGGRARFGVRTSNGEGTILADGVVLSVPARAAARLLRPHSADLADRLETVYYPPVAEVFTGFRIDQIRRSLDGFGFLIPAREKRRILGTIWSSAIFGGRAPEGYAALTTFVGGSRQPEMLELSDGELRNVVRDELRSIMGVAGEPAVERVIRWDRAIPQYNLGYLDHYRVMEEFESASPGWFLCGNYRGGIAVGDCVMNGERTAHNVRRHLERRSIL
jgi:oxygen-dependent protoporphyrinogen oxidase